jgi:uncharacterized protein (TIRG00374 family)
MTARFAAAAAASWTTFASFGMDVSLAEITGLCAAATLAALLPISPAGLGVAEGVFVAALRPHGFGSERILAACLTGRLLTAMLLGACALLYAATPVKDSLPPGTARTG